MVKKTDDIRVTKIEVEMGSQVVSLTIEQARALKAQLESLFGVKVEQVHHHHRDYLPWTQPRPYWCVKDDGREYTMKYDASSNSARLSV